MKTAFVQQENRLEPGRFLNDSSYPVDYHTNCLLSFVYIWHTDVVIATKCMQIFNRTMFGSIWKIALLEAY